MKKLVLLALISSCAIADTQPNPSDLTQVNSFVYGTMDSKQSAKVMLGLAGQYSEGNSFMGLLEHGYNIKDEDHTSRARYFQVFNTDTVLIQQAGLSVDYIKGWKKNGLASSDIVAMGTIGKIVTPWDSITLYPNVAYVAGKVGSKTVKGYQTNLFVSAVLSEQGLYAIFQPQWMDTNIGHKIEVKTGVGAPLSTDGKLWWDLSHTYQNAKMKNEQNNNDHVVTAGIAYYF